jgi:hypothetical protein
MSEAGKAEKDFWDKLDVLGKFVAGVVLGVVTIVLAYVYHREESATRDNQARIASAVNQRAVELNDYNSRTQRLSVVSQLMPLIKNGGRDKSAATMLLTFYGDLEVAGQIASLFPDDPEIRDAADKAAARDQTTAAPNAPAPCDANSLDKRFGIGPDGGANEVNSQGPELTALIAQCGSFLEQGVEKIVGQYVRASYVHYRSGHPRFPVPGTDRQKVGICNLSQQRALLHFYPPYEKIVTLQSRVCQGITSGRGTVNVGEDSQDWYGFILFG